MGHLEQGNTRGDNFQDTSFLPQGVKHPSIHEHLKSGVLAKDRNRKLGISTGPTKAKSREPACSQAIVQNKIDRHQVRSRESGK